MTDVILVTGGARSGKSSFAEAKAAALSERVLYIATAESSDDEMADRIKKHRESRPKSWMTIEWYKDFERLENNRNFLTAEVILLDCLSLMLNNWMYYSKINFDTGDFDQFDDFEKSFLAEIGTLIRICREKQRKIILVTNEIGMGLVPVDALSRVYRDILGRSNRLAATLSDEVYLLISGIPVKIK